MVEERCNAAGGGAVALRSSRKSLRVEEEGLGEGKRRKERVSEKDG